MGARQRLNSVYFSGILMVAAVCGMAMNSWATFLGVTVMLAAISVHGGSIRPSPTRRQRRFRRR